MRKKQKKMIEALIVTFFEAQDKIRKYIKKVQ